MADLSFYRLGTNPEAEAPRMRSLYSDIGVDKAVFDEFEATANTYRHSSLDEIAERITAMYVEPPVDRFGVVTSVDDVDVGMSIVGLKDFRRGESPETIPGANVSAWILYQHRYKGYGKRAIAHATALASYLTLDPNLPQWNGRQIWTSIKAKNTTSRRACEYAGFTEAGAHVDRPGRLLYVVE